MPSIEDESKRVEEIAEYQTIINRIALWATREAGVPERLLKFHTDGNRDYKFIDRIFKFNKKDMLKTERFLYKYYKMRCSNGLEDFFHNRNSESDEILKSCQSVYLFTLPQLTKRGHRIVCLKLAPSMTTENFDPKALFKRFFMVSDIRFEEDKECLKEVFILDMDGFTRQHAMKLFQGGFINKIVKCLKEIYPRRVHAVYLIRAKPWHRSTVGIWLKVSGVSKKMASRIKCFSMDSEEMEGLDAQVQQLSGRIQDLNDIWTKKLISYSAWFQSQETLFKSVTPKTLKLPPIKYKSCADDEELKISSHSEVNMFESLEGNFRKLDF